ncbi:TrkH family potassium uptake protein [Cerasicoccus fimbriatus]|uniref:TrkH family potassium uptake protein n=1 Tax=Cerasicoccus fimbriatus TaxID=3014554 RepID=UPI0022B582FE|nr:TrkH family potassium uptake protein [Cerasicoccus sp. TK19100]
MNYPIIAKLLSVIMSTIALAFLASYVVGEVFYGELDDLAREEWLISIAIASTLALVLAFLGRNATTKMFRKEALATIGLGWILASIVGAIPYYLILPDTSFADGVFESASGLTTTGASVFGDLDVFPRGLLFWRCLSQWIGGLGVVVFFVAILSFLGAGAKILYSNESSGASTDIESGRIQQGVLQILYLYLSLSVACALILKALGMTWYDSVCHMFTTLSTGGFGVYNSSVGAFPSPAIQWTIIIFMALGGTSFFVLLRVMQGRLRALTTNTEVIAYYAIILIVTSLLTMMLITELGQTDNWEASLRAAAFQTVSIITTTGFSTVDFQQWLPVGHMLLLCLMVFGGCSGSTAGGAKVVRIVVAFKVCRLQIEKAYRTRVVRPLHINGKVLDKEDQDNIVTWLLMLFLVLAAGIMIVAMLEHTLGFTAQVTSVFACLFNIGPGLAEVGPTQNYGFLREPTKLVLSLLMIMGRLELYAVLVLFSPALWRRFS